MDRTVGGVVQVSGHHVAGSDGGEISESRHLTR